MFQAMRDIGQVYERNFKGMTTEPVELGALLAARDHMVQELQSSLDADERRFLLKPRRLRHGGQLRRIEHGISLVCRFAICQSVNERLQ